MREPLLDDWVDGKPDAWDYEAVLTEHKVIVEQHEQHDGWCLSWKQGCIHIGQATEIIARKAAALFVSLWLRGVSASFADKLMDGYIVFLERQESTTLSALTEVKRGDRTGRLYFRLTREELLIDKPWDGCTEDKIIEAMGLQEGDQITVTFQKV